MQPGRLASGTRAHGDGALDGGLPDWVTAAGSGLLYLPADVAGATQAGPSGPYDTFGFAPAGRLRVFGEVTVGLTETLDLTVGLRQHEQNGNNWTLNQTPGVTSPKPANRQPAACHADPFAGGVKGAEPGKPVRRSTS